MENLNSQVYVYSVGTEAFYNQGEQKIHEKLLKVYLFKNTLKEKEEDYIEKLKLTEHKQYATNRETKLKEELEKADTKQAKKKVRKKLRRVRKYMKSLKGKMKRINKYKKWVNKVEKALEEKLYQSFTKNKKVRQLREDSLKDTNKIGLFDSVLSRTLGIKKDDTSTDIIIVRSYYYQVLEDIVIKGFTYKNEKYIYFSSSAGQIRTKKSVFIKKTVWDEHKDTLMCGLSIEDINKQGGMNVNKFLSYLALSNSASTEWKGFSIDRCIVVPDLSTTINTTVDYIETNIDNPDTKEYELSVRRKMDIEIEHTDGCGMMLPSVSKKAFMVRLPFMKGLLVPYPFDKQIDQANKKAGYEKYGKVTDIYGREWDIKKDKISIIFTKSQFKLWKYYLLEENQKESWNNYKTKFKENNCKAAKLNEEEDVFRDAKLNYQMLQTLTDLSKQELKALSAKTIKELEQIGTDRDTMLRVLGAMVSNKKKNNFQKAVMMYPEILNDRYTQEKIKETKKSMVRDARAAKLDIDGKYTFVIPDLYAFTEWLFLGVENPQGLLKNGEVFCKLYGKQKLDILRSPHLYLEHAPRQNVVDEKKKEWFVTKGVYTSVFDPISRILQFDVDGDKTIVVADQTLVSAAERNIKKHEIVPLYYKMAKAEPEIISNEKIYESLIKAYSANIGLISNHISKIWNFDDIDLELIKLLCCESNFTIDYAKTLYMPDRPEHIDALMKESNNKKLPHFFKYAKKKEGKNVEKKNKSVVNQLEDIIPNTRIHFEKVVGTFDYKVLMKTKSRKVDQAIIDRYNQLNRSKRWLMKNNKELVANDELWIYKRIRDELLKVNPNNEYVTDVLIKHLYGEIDSEYKDTLWWSFGDVILHNLKKNLKGNQCTACGERFEKTKQRQTQCEPCQDKVSKEKARLRKQKYNEKKKKIG